MLKGATARRYAEASFELAVEQHALDRWREDVRLIAEYFGTHQLQFILGEPNIRLDRKIQVVEDLLASKVQHDALGLALLLVERGLVELAPLIAADFEQRYNDYNNQVRATVTTARPLDEDLRERVRQDLHEITGKTILLDEQVDPEILGGVVARVGDTLIDGSVRRRLTLLRQQLVRGGGFYGGPNDGLGGGSGPNGPASPRDGDSGDGREGGGTGETLPFAVAPKSNADGASDRGPAPLANPTDSHNGPASANEIAPRDAQAPRLAPQTPPGQQPRQQPGQQPGQRPPGDNRQNNRDKRARRRR